MALIDLDKFVASFITEMKECSQMRNFSIPRCIKKALEDQGLEYKDGEIVKSQRRVSAESKENGYGESEDERIRKAIHIYLDWLDGRNKDYQPKGDYSIKDMIAWLEKQGEIDKTYYDIVEKEKYDFVSGQFIECRKSFNEFKEDNSYWLEYVGNDTYIGRSDNILNKKFHITPRQLYRLFTQQHCPKENNANEETNAPTEYGKYVNECLNEASKHFFSEGEDKYSVADLFYAGVRYGQSWLEKQDGRKLAEWNEEDENCLSTIIAEFSKCAGKSVSKDEWMRCNDFLNSLRDRVYAKQKWTEEDEGFLNLLFAIFTNEHPNGVFTTDNIPVFNGNCVTSNRIISWLKSIKQRIGE